MPTILLKYQKSSDVNRDLIFIQQKHEMPSRSYYTLDLGSFILLMKA
jgi:hypothetical protein